MNIAADCEINDDAFGAGLAPPEGAVVPALLRLPEGQLMEEYLRRFRLGAYTNAFARLDCGSGADGLERDWDLGVDGAHRLSDEERDAVRFRVAQGITASPGNVPKGWQRWAQEAFHPPQPWRELLGAAIRSAVSGSGVRDDYTYGRPACLPGVVLPSLRQRPPRVAVIVDTSGSVSDDELGSAIVEIAAIVRAVGGRSDLVSVLSCDAAVHITGPLCRAEGISLVGGGGTDLRAGFAKALRTNPRPDVIVALTDGQTPWPDTRPPCRTVVGCFLDNVDGMRTIPNTSRTRHRPGRGCARSADHSSSDPGSHVNPGRTACDSGSRVPLSGWPGPYNLAVANARVLCVRRRRSVHVHKAMNCQVLAAGS